MKTFEEQMYDAIKELIHQTDEKDQFRQTYLKTMLDRIEKAMQIDHIIHGYMIYQCKHCGKVYIMNLEKGLEDPTDDKNAGKHKPVPFTFPCIACGSDAYHIVQNTTVYSYGKNYRSYKEMINEPNKLIFPNFFWNDPESDCGVPIVFEPDFINMIPIGYGKTINYAAIDEFVQEHAVELPTPLLFFEDENNFDTLTEHKVERFETANREFRRHGPKGKGGYQRNKSNKKLYEY